MLRASIDIGSNSVLMLSGMFNADGSFSEYLNLSEVTGLGSGLDVKKTFADESMKATYDVLVEYKNEAIKLGIDPQSIIITATEASRVAKNARDFYQKVKKDLSLDVKIITAEGESYYSALGVYLGLRAKYDSPLIIMDVGGASTEIIKFQMSPFKIVNFVSLPLGSVRGKEWLDKNVLESKVQDILIQFSSQLTELKSSRLICIAGTMTSIANIFLNRRDYDDKIVHGTMIKSKEFEQLLASVEKLSENELISKFPFLGKRAKSLFSGGKVAIEVGKFLGVEDYEISVYGARYGTLFEGTVKDEFIIRK